MSSTATNGTDPIVFLDFDDVICCNAPYGGEHVFSEPRPADLWERLFAPEPVKTLLAVVERHNPKFVITTSWLRHMSRDTCDKILRYSGLSAVADRMHETWDAWPSRSMSRREAIERWLKDHHRGEPYVILDDELSGIGLPKSSHAAAGRVILCQQDVGLHEGHLEAIAAALEKPAAARSWMP